VADADDTAGALVALRKLGPADAAAREAAEAGVRWLRGLQNRDGGVPTFCRGWGTLPFDRSAPELTAHAAQAWAAWRNDLGPREATRIDRAIERALAYLARTQAADGSWTPLWFGNQAAPNEASPVYGTARVIEAMAEADGDRQDGGRTAAMRERGAAYLAAAQAPDGGWGGAPGVAASVEETAVAVGALARAAPARREAVERGAAWLVRQTEEGTRFDAAPVGLYFARLWYAERLYPVIFTVAALGRAQACLGRSS